MFDEGKFPPEMFVCPDHGSWYLDIYRAVDINRAVDIYRAVDTAVDSRNVRMLVSGQLAWAAWAGKLSWDHRPLPWRAGEAHTSVTTSPRPIPTPHGKPLLWLSFSLQYCEKLWTGTWTICPHLQLGGQVTVIGADNLWTLWICNICILASHVLVSV